MRTAGLPVLIIFWSVVIALIKKSWREHLGGWLKENPRLLAFLSAAIISANLLFVIFDEESSVGKNWFWIYISVAGACLIMRRDKPLGFPDLLIAAWLWVPVQLRWIHPSWGGGETAHVLVNFSVVILLLSGLFALRGQDPQLDWRFEWKDAGWVGLVLLALIPSLVWPAWVVGFVIPHLQKDWQQFPFALLEIWFTTALFEELIFRGVVQKTISQWLKPWLAIPVAAVIFGFYHITRTAGHRGWPNCWYVLFSGIAGLAYGLVYHKRNLQSAISTHCLVDFVWWLLLKVK